MNAFFFLFFSFLLTLSLSPYSLVLSFLDLFMFFETTYVPSPQLSAVSADDEPTPCSLTPEMPLPQPETAEDTLSDSPVNHLVFVIHGIGQQTEQYGHFYENIENLQETTRQILQAKVPDHNVRIELIPIEWHKHIHDQVDPILNRITLKSIPTVRLIENDYLADVLFYFSKDRGQKIIDNVIQLFNTSYQNFLEKHPDFNGEIVILGYSLGGVIVYDILSHQRTPEPEEEEAYSKLDVVFSKLVFKPTYFFGLGSPLGAVMTFRGQCPKKYHPDHDIIFENVFHPFDPLAYRFEPLLNEYYTDQPAVLVDRSIPIGPSFSFPSMSSLPGINFLSLFSWRMPSSGPNSDTDTILNDCTSEDNVHKSKDEETSSISSTTSEGGRPSLKLRSKTFASPLDIPTSVHSPSIKETAKKSEAEQAEEELEAERQFELKKLPGARRIDHVLQPESFMSMIANEYLVGMRAHFSYWTNKDLLWHIVRRLENLDDTVLGENSPKVGPEKPKSEQDIPNTEQETPKTEQEVPKAEQEKSKSGQETPESKQKTSNSEEETTKTGQETPKA
ncbi:DDHD domain-containing protein [Phycomyces blakesleeanus]|uniref:DDHD domain-containing protein n=1 Tax=Phycomyces blakesleeanus TaxID=4837 RepID=A0ABR3B8J9_PHYBL